MKRLYKVAEREGFEPPEVLPSTVFKTAAIDRSAISPNWAAKIHFFLIWTRGGENCVPLTPNCRDEPLLGHGIPFRQIETAPDVFLRQDCVFVAEVQHLSLFE